MNFKYPFEVVEAEARKYRTKTDFKKGNKPMYEAAIRRGWMKLFTWFEDGMKIAGERRRKWDYDSVKAEAMKCTSKKEFRELCPTGYSLALKNNWLADYDWFIEFSHPRNYWTRERCYEAALNCKTLSEFGRYEGGSAYNAALRNGWLDDYTWFDSGYVKRGYWTYERCYEEALKYTTKKDFSTKSHKAYDAAFSKGWLQDYTWLLDSRIDFDNDEIDSVYVYEFPGKVAYVGRTLVRLQKERDRAHLFNDKDTVCRYIKETGLELPEMKILEDGLTIFEGVNQEGFWFEKYKSEGWTMLNKAKTGSLGSLNRGKWNEKTCKEAAEKCETIPEFRKRFSGAYNVAKRRGYLSDYTWLKPGHKSNGYWDYEHCLEVALLCETKKEFRERFPTANKNAQINNWMKDYYWLTDERDGSSFWNRDKCLEMAKLCDSVTMFKILFKTCYFNALNNDWLCDYTWLNNECSINNVCMDYEICKTIAEHSVNRSDFKKISHICYQTSIDNNWLDIFFPRIKTN